MRPSLRLAISGLAIALVAPAVATSATADGTVTGERLPALVRAEARPSTTSAARAAAAAEAVTVDRLAGADRIETAIAASTFAWPNAGDENAAGAVILSRYDEFADALGGSALAGAAQGPLLMPRSGALDPRVEAEIIRLLGTSGNVYLLGGTGAISSTVESRLLALGYSTTRLSGADRYDTSVAIARQVDALVTIPEGHVGMVLATTGQNFPDGLAAGATAGGWSGSVVLTNDSTIPASVQAYLAEKSPETTFTIAVGGPSADAPGNWDGAIVGDDRFETAAAVAEIFWGAAEDPADDPYAIGLATGLDWPDALSGGAFMAGWGPLLLSRANALPAPTVTAVQVVVGQSTPSPVRAGAVFGGTSIVNESVRTQFQALLNP